MSEMNHEEARRLLPAYADGELELSQALAFEQHLQTCAECADALRAHKGLSAAVRGLAYHRAPDTLRMRLKQQLPLAEAAPAAVIAPAPPRRRELSRWAMPIAAGLALAIGLNFGLASRRADEGLREELVAAQVRSLQVEHLNDVASTDQHTVKPWFEGKLDFSPRVKDLAGEGFPLVGGRLDALEGHSVAALVYRRHLHVINLFQWPDGGAGSGPRQVQEQGYTAIEWSGDGMRYVAVSDVEEQELQRFVRAFRAGVPLR